jgi:hypothetical protein
MQGPDDELALAEPSLRSALKLSADEHDYLMSLDLAGRWRQQPAGASAWWGWGSLTSALATFGAWWLAAPLVGQLVDAASWTGLNVLLLRSLLMLGVSVGEALFALATSPALTYALAVLTLVAIALLAWPWSRGYRAQQQLA